jgi:hypothetical protein
MCAVRLRLHTVTKEKGLESALPKASPANRRGFGVQQPNRSAWPAADRRLSGLPTAVGGDDSGSGAFELQGAPTSGITSLASADGAPKSPDCISGAQAPCSGSDRRRRGQDPRVRPGGSAYDSARTSSRRPRPAVRSAPEACNGGCHSRVGDGSAASVPLSCTPGIRTADRIRPPIRRSPSSCVLRLGTIGRYRPSQPRGDKFIGERYLVLGRCPFPRSFHDGDPAPPGLCDASLLVPRASGSTIGGCRAKEPSRGPS